MTRWVKKGALWLADIGDTPQEGLVYKPALYPPSNTKPLLPSRDFRGLPPGAHYPPGGFLYVPPKKKIGRFLRIDVQKNEKQMTLLSSNASLLRPGKKEKTKGRKPRPTRVEVELPNDDIIDYIFSPYDGSATHICAGGRLVTPIKVVIENYYERAKKDKVINKFVYTNDWVYQEVDAAIRRYDQVYAIDTNSVKHKSGRLLSVSAVVRAKVEPLESGFSVFQATPFWAIRAIDVEGKPEVEAWKALINKLIPSLDADEVRRIGIVVDSELGQIESLNLGLESSLDFFLPPGFELIYATESTGSDQFTVNYLVSMCHKLSTDLTQTYKRLSLEELEKPDATASQGDS